MDKRTRPRRRLSFVEGLVIFGIIALLISIALPSLNRARELSMARRCPSNLKQIGQAILLYCIERKSTDMPTSLATLARESPEYVRPEVFICPSDDATAAKDLAAFVADAGAANCSYVYVGDRVPMNIEPGGEVLVAFDRPDTHGSDGVNALFADGHVEFMTFLPADGPIARGWRDVEVQIARGDRPVRWIDPTTRPTH